MNMLTPNMGTTYQLYFNSCLDNIEVMNNKLSINKTLGQHYCIYASQNNAQNKKGLFANNFITSSNTNNNDLVYGIYVTGCSNQYVVNNNIHIGSNNSSSSPLYFSNGSNNRVINNNAFLTNKGIGILILQQSVNISNYNNIYAPQGNFGIYNNITYTSLFIWKNITGFDQNSISVDPLFKDSFDLHTCAIELIGSGLYLTYVLEDIDGQLRDQNKPYIGADVFMDFTDFLQGTYTKCIQDSIALAINTYPNEALTYLWSPGGETTPSILSTYMGWHYLTITTACGLFIDSVEVTLKPLPISDFNTSPNFENVQFYNFSINSTSWQWNFGDGGNSTAFNPSYTYTNSGTYNVQLIACNDCGCDTLIKQVTVVVSGVNEFSASNKIKVTPNPTNGLFTLHTGKEYINRVEILDIQGNVVYLEDDFSRSNTAKNIKLESAPGIYFVKIFTNENIYLEKIAIQ